MIKIEQVFEFFTKPEDKIITATMSSEDECVLLISSGNVIKYNFSDLSNQWLFSVYDIFEYQDGGFDINDPSRIYTMDSIVVLVNRFKLHGIIHYPGNYKNLRIIRGSSSVGNEYPIALFKNKDNVPHLIYAMDWNHLQIMNLDTRQILTAAKSLIEEGAEERHLEFYKEYKEDNKFLWPTPYNYNYGELFISPDCRNFLSAGWISGSYDKYTVYNIDDFIRNPSITENTLNIWERLDRAVCWIDNRTIAVACNPLTCDPFDEYENSNPNTPDEIHFYNIDSKEPEIIDKVVINNFKIVKSRFYYDRQYEVIISVSKEIGICVITPGGEVLFHDVNIIPYEYYPETHTFIIFEDHHFRLYKLNIEK